MSRRFITVDTYEYGTLYCTAESAQLLRRTTLSPEHKILFPDEKHLNHIRLEEFSGRLSQGTDFDLLVKRLSLPQYGRPWTRVWLPPSRAKNSEGEWEYRAGTDYHLPLACASVIYEREYRYTMEEVWIDTGDGMEWAPNSRTKLAVVHFHGQGLYTLETTKELMARFALEWKHWDAAQAEAEKPVAKEEDSADDEDGDAGEP